MPTGLDVGVGGVI